MKKPTAGSRKKATAENLRELGVDRLADILADVAETRVDLKRRLRMELAAQQGPGVLAAEIDKRLNAFEASRGRVAWRQGPAFIRDLDATRDLIVARLAPLDAPAAVDRLWRFMDTASQSSVRYRDRNGELSGVYAQAAGDLGQLLRSEAPSIAASALVESLIRNIAGWKDWLPALLEQAPKAVAENALALLSNRPGGVPGWIILVRHLADAAADVDAYRATYTKDALKVPSVAAELARRYLAHDQLEAAGAALSAAGPKPGLLRAQPPPDPSWESLWIAYLDRSGRQAEAQAVRWSAFERTLSSDWARDFISRLPDFDDVEAENRAFVTAAGAADFQRGLRFFMEWPALGEASRMIERRREEVQVDPDMAELWAAKLRRRYPEAAYELLRRAAAAAFRRRDYKTCDRLSAEAETLSR